MSRVLAGVCAVLLTALVALSWRHQVQAEALHEAQETARQALARAEQATGACTVAMAFQQAGSSARETAERLKASMEDMPDAPLPDHLRNLLGGLAGVVRPVAD